MIRTSLAALFLASLAGTATAADLTAVQTVQKVVVSEDGTGTTVEQLVDAVAVAPGDTVVYSLSYENSGDADADGVKLTMPVPAEVVLLEGSEITRGTTVTYSADGGASYAARADLEVVEGDTTRSALSDEITHIQWLFEDGIPAGEAGTVSFRGVLR
ncbi:MAG: hypothetical protein AAFR33_11475 [Pseudomonadota bacterium]